MRYRVEVMPGAMAEAEEIYRWLLERSPSTVTKWFNGLAAAIFSLERNPKRCSFAPENDAFEEEIRQLLYGKRGGVYRILFTIVGDTVKVLHIRHGARRFLES